MIRFSATGRVTAKPRARQGTTEAAYRHWQQFNGRHGVKSEWDEPPRIGVAHGGVPFTIIRVKTYGKASEEFDVYAHAPYTPQAAFERAVALEVGAGVRIEGQLTHDNARFTPRLTALVMTR